MHARGGDGELLRAPGPECEYGFISIYKMKTSEPEKKIREVVDACTDCDVCRHLMDADCLFFPELYRLWDQEQTSGEASSADALRRLVDLCNFCALWSARLSLVRLAD